MGGAAALAHQDVSIAVNCSANAIENNFVAHLVGGAVGGLALALEAAGVVEAGIAANMIWGALGTGSLMVACELTKNAMDETPIGAGTIYSTPEAESIDGREGYDATPSTGTVMSTPIADALDGREGYKAAPKEYLYNTGKGFTPTDLPDTFILNSLGYEGNAVENKQLLPGEGRVGTFKELDKMGKKGDNLTPNHIPQAAYMEQKLGIHRNDGVSMFMEQPVPGSGGRHRQTRTYGTKPDLTADPRSELARDILDVRNIYKNDNLYKPEIKKSLIEVVKLNKDKFPDVFGKK